MALWKLVWVARALWKFGYRCFVFFNQIFAILLLLVNLLVMDLSILCFDQMFIQLSTLLKKIMLSVVNPKQFNNISLYMLLFLCSSDYLVIFFVVCLLQDDSRMEEFGVKNRFPCEGLHKSISESMELHNPGRRKEGLV